MQIFMMCLSVFIVGLVGFFVTDAMLDSAVGEHYTEEKWFAAEQIHCVSQGMEAVEYVGQNCGLFGCIDVEKTKCVGTNREKLIDYDDKIFCKYKLAGDYGWC